MDMDKNKGNKVEGKKKKQSFGERIFTRRDIVYTAVCLIVLIVAIIVQISVNKRFIFEDIFDIKIFSAVIIAFLLNALTNIIINFIKFRREDKDKLTEDYDALLKMYPNVSSVIYTNSNQSNYKVGRKKTKCAHIEYEDNRDEYKIPLTDILYLEYKDVYIKDNPQDYYQLPDRISDSIGDIYKAHNFSKTYNQMNIRCSGISCDEENVEMKFSRTSYLYSLVTNRAIDFKKDGISVRDMYACGPFLPTLENSELSNHIGFNGFVETEDGYVVFILRHKHVSIAKNTLQPSVGASLKAKYALLDKYELTKEGIINAIRNEIEDELNLTNLPNYKERRDKIFADLSFKSIKYFYRELVEGGKPQFLFVTKIAVSKDELIKAYVEGMESEKSACDKYGLYSKVDGYKMLTVNKEHLDKIYVTPDGMVVNKKRYKSVPASTGTFALYMNYLKKKVNVIESFTCSKSGIKSLNEDGIYISDSFIAVIDGATSKKNGTIDGISSGRFAMNAVREALDKLDPEISATEGLKSISNYLREKTRNAKVMDDSDFPAVSIVYYNRLKGEIVSYGDCAFSINGEVNKPYKKSDAECAEKRAEIIKSALESGATEEEIRRDDIGRKAIINDLIYNAENFANVKCEGGFGCINGKDIIEEYVTTRKIEKGNTVVMCSDGYPKIFNTLKESEDNLAELLSKDKLCINELKGTKGVNENCVSFDDRSYIKFEV